MDKTDETTGDGNEDRRNGPWGAAMQDGGDEAGEKPANPGGSGPRNPWEPRGGEPPRRSAGIEDIFRPLGKNGGGGPRRPGSGGPGGPGRGFPGLGGGEARWLPLALGAVLAIGVLSTMIHQLGPTEQGIVTTFGKYSRTVGSGLNLTAPWPIQRVAVTDVTSIRRESIPDTDGEKLMLTSDQNLVDLSYLVRWNIRDLKSYAFQLKDPKDTVHEVAEAAMRASVAEVALSEVMGGSGRAAIEQAVRTRMQRVLDAYRAGVLVQGVDIKKADPPEKVNAAYQQVSAAQQEARRDMSQAQAYAATVLARAQGETSAFDQVYAQYKLAPGVTRRRMYYETMEKVLGQNDKVIMEGNSTSYLPLPELRRRAQAETATGGQ